MSLPPEDRAALAKDLIARRDAADADPSADALWLAEIERRSREIDEGKGELVDSDQVHAEISARLRARAGR